MFTRSFGIPVLGICLASASINLAARNDPGLPVRFEPNRGQAGAEVAFLSRGNGYAVGLTRTGAVLSFRRAQTVRMKLAGANPAAAVQGLDPLPGTSNYFIGNDPARWRTNIPNFARVRFQGVYPGIDLVYYGARRKLEYDFVVSPGADPNRIQLAFSGCKMRLDASGNLVLSLPAGEVVQHKPVVYQDVNGARRIIEARYVLNSRGLVGIRLAAYDGRLPLVIDPSLTFATFLGGVDADSGRAIALDASGNVYVTGFTASVNFPVRGGLFPASGITGDDVFVAKLNPEGTELVYSAILGGTGNETGTGIAIDSIGNAFVTGMTDSFDFPTTSGTFQEVSAGRSDAFIAKLNPSGSGLVYSTFFGGEGRDSAAAIAVDVLGNAYVTGQTNSSNFPVTQGVVQVVPGGGIGGFSDVFVAKLSPTGTALVFCTFLGGTLEDRGTGIAIDAFRNVYVAGTTESHTFPVTPGAFRTVFSGTLPKAFAAKLNLTATRLVYSTFLGGSGADEASGIALDSSQNAYITGTTTSRNFPTTPGAFQVIFGGGRSRAFVSKLSFGGSALLYSTFLGGSIEESASGIAVDESGNASITGTTASTNFPTTADAFQKNLRGFADAFVTKLNPAGTALLFSTLIGGALRDQGLAIASGPDGEIAATGDTASLDFPTTPGVLQPKFGGIPFDAWVAKIAP